MDNASAQHLIKAVNQLTKVVHHQNAILIEFARMWKEDRDRQEAQTDGVVRGEVEAHGDGDSDLGSAGEGEGRPSTEWPREGLD